MSEANGTAVIDDEPTVENLGDDLPDDLNALLDETATAQAAPATVTDPKVVETLEAVAEKLDKNSDEQKATAMLAQLMGNPEIRAVLDRMQSGQPTPKQEEKPEPAPDFDKMTNAELAQYTINSTVRAVEKLVDSKLNSAIQPLTNKMQTVDQLKAQQEKARIDAQVAEMKQTCPGWEKYRDDMIRLSQQAPTLSATQLYKLAKSERGEAEQPAARKFVSERPTSSSARPNRVTQGNVPSGSAGFRTIVRRALSDVDLSA